MEGRGQLKSDPAYVKLQEYFEANGDKLNINAEFQKDPERFKKFRWDQIQSYISR